MSSGEPHISGGPAAAPVALDWLHGDVDMLRAEYERQRARPMPENAEWLDVPAIGRTIPVLVHHGAGPAETAIVYFHGGGFIVGSPLTHSDITSALCQRTGMPLYSVDYRLAPEHHAPAQIDDGLAVIEHLLADMPGRQIILCGDSAGATIALALAQSLPQPLRKHIPGVACFYGAYGLFDTPSLIRKGSRADGLDRDCVRRYFDLVTGGVANHPFTFPALSKPLPIPVYLLAGDEDPLLDDTRLLAEALARENGEVTISIVAGEGHGFLHDAVPSRPAADALDHVAAWLEDLGIAGP